MTENAYVKYTIEDILDNFKQPIPFIQPLYESIANSLEAKATNILVEFYVDEAQQTLDNDNKQEESSFKVIKRVCGFLITDNGVGFTEKNIDSFTKFKSKLKKKLGCKGVGRFTWLKVFENINIESNTGNQLIKFDFNKNFSVDKIKPVSKIVDYRKTIISFSDVTSLYKKFAKTKKEKDIDERIIADLKEIKKTIEEHLLVKLFLLHEEDEVRFEIKLKYKNDEEIISNDTIIKLHKKEFKILDNLDTSLNPKYYNFALYYAFEQNIDKKPIQSYCAAGRLVAPFTETVKVKNLPENTILTMLLTSEYFDERTYDERNDLSFSRNDVNRNIVNPISISEINDQLKKLIDEILLEKFPNLNANNNKIISECIEEYPHLAKYIKQDESKIKEKGKVINQAEQKYQKEKEKVKSDFAKMLESKKPAQKDVFLENVAKVNDISARELAQYFLYREQVIKALKKINDENNSCEADLHNLFMEMGKISIKDKSDYSIYDSNLWLIDDKFMSYFASFSDKQIKIIKETLLKTYDQDEDERKEPDLAIFYSKANEKEKDIVVIEFKPIEAKSMQKGIALFEVNRNIGAIASSFDDIRNIYGYIITKIDDEFCRAIKYQGLHKLFSNGKTPMFYYYNNGIEDKNGNPIDAHIYFLSAEMICDDAMARNKLFLDIIKNKN